MLIIFYVYIKFHGNRLRDFGFGTRKPPRKFHLKSGFIQKRLKYGKKIFHMVESFKISFHPYQPTFGSEEQKIFSFFSLFFLSFLFFFPVFSSWILNALLLLNHKTSKSNFCVKFLSCKRNFVSRKIFGFTHQWTSLQWSPKKSIFWTVQAWAIVVFYISQYSIDEYFDKVWGYYPPETPPNGPRKSIFLTSQAWTLVFMSADV